jgi:hypothetical protein
MQNMGSALLTIEILIYAFALWLGLYLLARDLAKPLLRYAGLGLVAYALGLAADLLSAYAPGLALTAALVLAHEFLILLPALFWTGALLHVLPEDTPRRAWLIRWWSRVFVPAAVLGYLLAAGAGLVGGGLARVGYLLLALLALVPLLAGLGLLLRYRRAIRPRGSLALLLAATLFFTLGLGLLVVPLGWLPREWALLAIGGDLVMLDIAIVVFDAFDEGETLLPDITRSFAAALLLGLLFGFQVALAMIAGAGATFPMLALLLATLLAAIGVALFANPLQSAIDRLVFARTPRLWQARDAARAAASALPRANAELDLASLDEAEFVRLTRRALSHYGDLPRLAASPLIRLPQVTARLAERGAAHGDGRPPGDTLEPAAELKALLAESIARLKPRGQGDFGTTDEWRYYNALYFPYVAGLKPYSRRVTMDGLDRAARQALEWFRATVPERTLYNWQNAAARLVSQDLRGRMERVRPAESLEHSD